MARGRGGPKDFRGALGSLFQATLEGVGAVREVVEQQTRQHGGVVDQARNAKKRKDALSRLGEAVYALHQEGALGELILEPSIGALLEELDVDASEDFPDEAFADEGFHNSQRRDAVSSQAFVSSSRSASSSMGADSRVWRPTRNDLPGKKHTEAPAPIPSESSFAESDNSYAAASSRSAPIGGSKRVPRKTAERHGSAIRFVESPPQPEDLGDESDLGDYMHEDDVP